MNWYSGAVRHPLPPAPTVALGGQQFIVTREGIAAAMPFTVDAIRAAARGDGVADCDAAVRFVHAMLLPHYPDLTIEMLEDNATPREIRDFYLVVFAMAPAPEV